ncbi:GYDIA family GHMP kinase [Poritiphilus flavus]|uniref:GHMP kinase n=1 Tax=Poritiphilus flavus TaxID=2697053 RepID=A0A6L9EDU5_9FLAO|nr:GYDIA family GHMP kinase [Poritiphilus flavus]NAS12811.1 GHMP kinase [Poritiphilus flavus]
MEREFRSNGKLLLTGEYAVLDGALSLAVPTRFGQSLKVLENNSGLIRWKSLDQDNKVWFESEFPVDILTNTSKDTDTDDISLMLMKILSQARNLNPDFLEGSRGYEVVTQLDFPRNWGLGTSSTLINNIAQWAMIDAFDLLHGSIPGSGYDIACAQHSTAILYQIEDSKPRVTPVDFSPPFQDQLFFVFLNRKQNSREAIAHYREKTLNKAELIAEISGITEGMVNCNDLHDFIHLMETHEQTLSEVLGLDTVKSSTFPDYPGAVKSLGAWGGDFVLAAGEPDSPVYFKRKGYATVFAFKDLVLNKKAGR